MTTGMFDSREYLVAMDLPALADRLAVQTGRPQMKEEMEFFMKRPSKDGLSVCLSPNASIFLCVPNLLFGEKFKLGSHVWVYFTETQEWACLQQEGMKRTEAQKDHGRRAKA